MDNAKVKLEETDNRHRLHIGSYFVDLNENQYQELIKIFSKQNSPVLDNNKQKESEKWQKIYSKLIKKHDEARLTDTNTNGKLLLHSEISKEVAVKFGRYLLKEAAHHWDKDATLCWKVANDEYDTDFLFDKYIHEVF